jgi:hypothetical protein
MPSGGPRPGGGRPKGVLNKRSMEIAKQAALAGSTPLDVMIENMRFAHEKLPGILHDIIKGKSLPETFSLVDELLKYRRMAQEAAKDAAPYMHPRLTAMEVANKEGESFQQTVVILPANSRD